MIQRRNEYILLGVCTTAWLPCQ